MNAPVLFERLPTTNGRHLGHVRLNALATLNSLSLEMIDLIQAKIDEWRDDDDIVALFFDAEGDKAFSAGGDIQALYHDMKANPGGPCTYCDAFFEREYRLDYQLRQYPKPTIAWGHGIVMGVGLGILSACTYRIGTETTRIAMPEITIGLFPDAGGTYTFSRMDPVFSHFIALTAANINARDGLLTGMLSHLIQHDQKAAVLHALLNSDVDQANVSANLDEILVRHNGEAEEGFAPANLAVHEKTIRAAFEPALIANDPIKALAQNMEDWPEDKWLQRARASFLGGSPVTAQVILEQFARAKTQSMAEMFCMELDIATACSVHGEFTEGVRALLIDKDGSPAWQYPLGEVPKSHVERHFDPVATPHPLQDLA